MGKKHQASSAFLELGILSSVPKAPCGDVYSSRKHIAL